MVDCEYSRKCSFYEPRNCNDMHIGCLRREMNSRFDELIGTFRSILPIPETDRRYRLCLEAEDIFDTVMKRLEEIFGTEEAGRIIRDST